MLLVTGSWVSSLTTLIPLALVIAISPLSVIPAVLVLQTPRPRPTGLAFLGGWLLGLIVLTAIFAASSDALGDLRKSPPTWASWLRIVLGSALIAFGIYRWLTREGHTESPRWMRSFETLTPSRAVLIGLALVVVRVEVLTMCALAGLDIGSVDLGVAAKLLTAAIFIAVAASTVAIPVLAYAAAGHRLDETMARLKAWMEKNNAALLAAILVLIGLMVLHNGVKAL
ncbi:GAP family protein [Mycobacterium cookii]|uniref:Membrane protein n=1 Tax=Mycobacterium cookii TaxID=1775 RepID=A0A7I7L1R0_9MYCO|nr:GAP family protein [Mycobacterium cookii]MCV7333267.1 GAP family protein [Mycobacterium cookii]BBX47718.1 membrane protein [Mycobacterium cookii]